MRMVLACRRNIASNHAVCGYEMTADPLSIAHRACLALCLIVVAAGNAWAATAPVYKCLDKHRGLVYTDEPCL